MKRESIAQPTGNIVKIHDILSDSTQFYLRWLHLVIFKYRFRNNVVRGRMELLQPFHLVLNIKDHGILYTLSTRYLAKSMYEYLNRDEVSDDSDDETKSSNCHHRQWTVTVTHHN